jgi:hypothetical protein
LCILKHLKVKEKIHPRTGHEGPEGECRYSSTLSLTSALDEGGCSTPRSSCFTPVKTRSPSYMYRRLGGPQGRSGRVRKTLPPTVFDLRTVQPVATPTELSQPTLKHLPNKILLKLYFQDTLASVRTICFNIKQPPILSVVVIRVCYFCPVFSFLYYFPLLH